RAALGGLEGNRSFPPALGAGSHGFAFGEPSAPGTLTLGLTRFATLRFILEILVVKEVLLACGEYEIRSAVHTLEDSILKLRHGHYPRQPELLVGSVIAGLRPRHRLLDFPA